MSHVKQHEKIKHEEHVSLTDFSAFGSRDTPVLLKSTTLVVFPLGGTMVKDIVIISPGQCYVTE